MMAFHTTAAYPTYSPPRLHPTSRYIIAPHAPTARDRYLHAVAEAQAARERYLSELEEERILASLRQQEALRQAELLQRQVLAVQHPLARRRLGRIHANNYCQAATLPQPRRQTCVRFRNPQYEQESHENSLEDALAAFFGGRQEHDERQKQESQKSEEIRVEQAKKAAVRDAHLRFINKLDTIRAEVQAAREKAAAGPSPGPSTEPREPSNKTEPTATPQPDVPRKRSQADRAACTIQRRWRSHSADAAARKDAVATIATLQARLQFLRDTFSFPEHLEFRERVADQGIPALLFTPANAAVHAHMHELTKLLTLADAVPSRGSREVRDARRRFVRSVEEALDSVEVRVAKVWGKRAEIAAEAQSVVTGAVVTSITILPVTAPEASDVTPSSDINAHVAEPIPAAVPESNVPISSSQSDYSIAASTIVPPRAHTNDDEPQAPTPETDSAAEQPLLDTDRLDEPQESILPPPMEDSFVSPDDVTTTDAGEKPEVTAEIDRALDSQEVSKTEFTEVTLTSVSVLPLPSDAPAVPTTTDDEPAAVDPVPVSRDEDVSNSTDESSPAQAFDIVYPDSPSTSSVVIGDEVDPRYEIDGTLESTEESVGSDARSTVDGTQKVSDVGDTEEFELL